jgi:hypothetical protein
VMTTRSVVVPREKRGIQYAAALRLNHRCLWNTCMGLGQE